MVKPEVPAAIKSAMQKIGVYQALEGKYGVDWVYENIFARGARAFGSFFWKVGDQAIIDGAIVNGSWKLIGRIGQWVRKLQSGYLYHYALVMLLGVFARSEEHTSELQSPCNLVCRLLLEKKKQMEHKSEEFDVSTILTHLSALYLFALACALL